MAVKPKEASTVILLRKSSKPDKGNFEVLMVLRHPKSRFVPGSYVFPGGCLDEQDYAPEMEGFCTGMTLTTAQALLHDMSSPGKALGAWIAGIRETFEEVGVLMAYRSDKTSVFFDTEGLSQKFCSYRQGLQEGKLSFTSILRNEGLTLACDRLHYFSHWITPELLPLRYDVRFFVAKAPENQTAMHDGVELTTHIWITPQQALAGFNRKTLNMVVPTLVTIEDLSKYSTIDEVIASTKNKDIRPILTVMVEEAEGVAEFMSDGRVFKHMPPSVL